MGKVVVVVAIGDLLRFTVTMQMFGEVVINVDFRRFDASPSGSQTEATLARSYFETFEQEVLPILSDSLTLLKVECDNLTDGISFGSWSGNVAGGQVSPGMPSYVAYSIRLNRATKITRNGGKRLAGCTEATVTDNDVNLLANLVDDIEFFYGGQTLFIDPSGGTQDVDLFPVIIGRTKNAQGVYELDLTKVNEVLTATLNSKVSSQNSRKPTL